ncbi:MAG: fibronectin type III domain-containing protein [Ruminococcus sp.]|nr:fibronectin type III domain-containing protein [Ruminococcus sp.]
MDIRSRAAAVLSAAVMLASGAGITAYADEETAPAAQVTSLSAPEINTAYDNSTSDVRISWSKVTGATGYYVYRRVSGSTWTKLAKLSANTTEYINSDLASGRSYGYYVAAFNDKGSSEIVSDPSATLMTTTKPSCVRLTAPEVTENAVTVKWQKLSASGYVIRYKAEEEASWKTVSVQSSGATQYKVTGLTAGKDYTFNVYAYCFDSKRNVFSSDIVQSVSVTTPETPKKSAYELPDDPSIVTQFPGVYSPEADRLNSAKLTPGKTSFKSVNAQGSVDSTGTVYLSEKDIAILQAFADKYFKPGWTNAEKVNYTIRWINRNIAYANGVLGPSYGSIAGLSYVEATFVRRAGQCLQYNGAITAMLTYLGYDAALVQGYRGRTANGGWQHFWCEVYINGETYVCDSYNYGDSGDWLFVCNTYQETCPYSYNAHYIKNYKLL